MAGHSNALSLRTRTNSFNYIYSQSYEIRSKRYLTSFAVKRDFFHSFFGSSPDGLDQHPKRAIYEDGVTDNMTRDGSSARLQDPGGQPTSERSPPLTDIPDPQVSQEQEDHRRGKNLDHTVVSLKPSQEPVSPMQATTRTTVGDQSAPVANNQSQSAIVRSEVNAREKAVPLAEASHLLFNKQANAKKRSFSVLSPTNDGGFRRREADALDRPSMINALWLPSGSHFMARDNGKGLKMTAPTTILEEARSERPERGAFDGLTPQLPLPACRTLREKVHGHLPVLSGDSLHSRAFLKQRPEPPKGTP